MTTTQSEPMQTDGRKSVNQARAKRDQWKTTAQNHAGDTIAMLDDGLLIPHDRGCNRILCGIDVSNGRWHDCRRKTESQGYCGKEYESEDYVS